MTTITQPPLVLTGRGQLFRDDCAPIDVRYRVLVTARAQHAAVPAAPRLAPNAEGASGSLVVLNHADIWCVDVGAGYQLALANGKRCRVALQHDPHQPFTKYRILCSAEDLL